MLSSPPAGEGPRGCQDFFLIQIASPGVANDLLGNKGNKMGWVRHRKKDTKADNARSVGQEEEAAGSRSLGSGSATMGGDLLGQTPEHRPRAYSQPGTREGKAQQKGCSLIKEMLGWCHTWLQVGRLSTAVSCQALALSCSSPRTKSVQLSSCQCEAGAMFLRAEDRARPLEAGSSPGSSLWAGSQLPSALESLHDSGSGALPALTPQLLWHREWLASGPQAHFAPLSETPFLLLPCTTLPSFGS